MRLSVIFGRSLLLMFPPGPGSTFFFFLFFCLIRLSFIHLAEVSQVPSVSFVFLRALPESLDSTLGRWTLYKRPNGEASLLLAEIYVDISVRALAIFQSMDLRNLICSSCLLSKRFII